ncbi:S8 family serine peptidase [Tellurirhabdus bombi]|uniref:S8 family serine peptidase n=1 Tax=Tellurirhabdus bombi TaxID=2907205 RepID=UPI001F40BD73|nr:S8 family serine peptidase [Tellurirhabdus bombi]
MKKTILLLSLVLTLVTTEIWAQTTSRKYLVLLTDKANSPYSIARPEQFLSVRSIQRRNKQNIALTERDLPVNPSYVSAIRAAGATVWFTSRWSNAVLIQSDEATLAKVQALPFVKGIENNRALGNVRASYTLSPPTTATQNRSASKLDGMEGPTSYGISTNQLVQIGVDKMHEKGFHGEGMLVAILDAGFRNANTMPYLQHLFQDNKIVGTYDFVRKESSVYEDDSHGLNVLSIMAGYSESQLIGPAYRASYLLLRTEEGGSEMPIEEANWLLGAEYADSTGADVINSSLGYTTFDDPAQNHTYKDLDGQTTLVSRAARWASEAGMVVVVSAGNEGASNWKYIAPPADVATVLAIGAVNVEGRKASFSSFGPTSDGRVKPDLVATGLGTVLGTPGGSIATGNGTSFSAPLVAALATGLWQAFPRLSAQQIIESLRQSGSQYGTPDAELGYGIPHFSRASTFANEKFSFQIYPNPFTDADRLTVLWNELPLNQVMDATLTSVTGQVIWKQRYSTDQVANLTLSPLRLAPGMYFLTLSNNAAQRTVKLLKQ